MSRVEAPPASFSLRSIWDPSGANTLTHRRAILFVIAIAWLTSVLVTVSHHEFERDEVRALSIAVASPSLWELPQFLKNEGHPVVWYALLRMGHQVFDSPTVLPLVSVLIAGASILLLLFGSPFPLAVRILFTFSVLPLYEYSVSARNYGISMLLMFGFAIAYAHRRQHPFIVAAVLALLANTNVHSLLIAGVLTLLWLWDELIVDRLLLTRRRVLVIGLASALILTAALLCLVTTWPDNRTIATTALKAGSVKDYLRPLLEFIRRPWTPLTDLIPVPLAFAPARPWRVVQILIIAWLWAGLCVRPRLAVALLATYLAFGYLFNFAYGGSLRHQGILLVFALTLYWLSAATPVALPRTFRGRLHALALVVVWPVVLLWGSGLAVSKVSEDNRLERSSSQALNQWLESRPEYQGAILIGEPDYYLESLPYYNAHRMYLARESRFGRWVKFTTESVPAISLGEVLDAAQQIKQREHQPVLVALGFPSEKFEAGSSIRYGFNRVLTWTPAEWQRFKQTAKYIRGFWSARSDENFDIYEIQ